MLNFGVNDWNWNWEMEWGVGRGRHSSFSDIALSIDVFVDNFFSHENLVSQRPGKHTKFEINKR